MSEELKAALARIACLEGEIAKRDAELAACRVAVENCELFRARIAELEAHAVRLGQGGAERYWEGRWRDADAQLSKSMRQEPVGEVVEVNERGNCSFKGVINASAILEDLVVNGTKLYAAPVSEAKAQGVVQWPEADEIMQMAFEEGHPADDASGYYFELEEFDLFIERLMSEVARLNTAPAQQASVPDGWRELAKRADDFLYSLPETDGVLRLRADLCSMLAAPAAPAADVTVRQATDGGRNQSYEGLFDGETEEQRASRLAAHCAKGAV